MQQRIVSNFKTNLEWIRQSRRTTSNTSLDMRNHNHHNQSSGAINSKKYNEPSGDDSRSISASVQVLPYKNPNLVIKTSKPQSSLGGGTPSGNLRSTQNSSWCDRGTAPSQSSLQVTEITMSQ